MISLGNISKSKKNVTIANVSNVEGGSGIAFDVTLENENTSFNFVDVVVSNKNIFKFPNFTDIHGLNTLGTWQGNKYTYNGIVYTFTVSDDKVTQLNISGEATNPACYLFLGQMKFPKAKYLVKTSWNASSLILRLGNERIIGNGTYLLDQSSYVVYFDPNTLHSGDTINNANRIMFLPSLNQDDTINYEENDQTVYRINFPATVFYSCNLKLYKDGWATAVINDTYYNFFTGTIPARSDINNVYLISDYTNSIFINSIDFITDSSITSDVFYNAIANDARQHARISYILSNIVFEDSDIVLNSGIVLDSDTGTSNKLEIGKSYSSQVSFQLIESLKTNRANLSSQFKVEFGFELEDDSTLWIQFGLFKGNDVTYDISTGIYSVTAYDRMTMFDTDVKPFLDNLTDLEYSPRSLFYALCDYIGLEYIELASVGSQTIPVADIQQLEDVSTCRGLLDVIAETYGTYAKITNDGKVMIIEHPFSELNPIPMYNDDCYELHERNIAQTNSDNDKWEDISNYLWSDLVGSKYNELYEEISHYVPQGTVVISKDEDYATDPYMAYTEYSLKELKEIFFVINNNIFFNSYFPNQKYNLWDIIRQFNSLYGSIPDLYATIVSASDKFILLEPGDMILKYISDNTTNYKLHIVNKKLIWNGSFTCEFNSPQSLL